MLEPTVFGTLDNSASASGDGGGGEGVSASAAVEEGSGVLVLEEGDRNSNRWPREETLALLKIRSEMDLAFRDSTLKAPLWDEISRKLGELGYQRSAKKCKEKFENIFKYHKRTKEGRSGRLNGKNYRFFEQLEVFDSNQQPTLLPSPSTNTRIRTHTMQATTTPPPPNATAVPTTAAPMIKPVNVYPDFKTQNPNFEFMSTSTSNTSSSGKDSGGSFKKKKKKLVDYFENLMKQVLERQENLQNKFLDAIEKCENDRIAREEAWKMQEMARVKREQELLAQERAIAAAKDAAVIAFLQKISAEQAISPVQLPPKNINPVPDKLVDKEVTIVEKRMDTQDHGVGDQNATQGSSSRWPKSEVEDLIRLRTNLDLQYQDNGAKGPLWEEVSSAMKKLGYDRSAKRCKEKWENINKYYRRVKESNKRRPEDSKTCPYFHLLESIYERKSRRIQNNPDASGGKPMKPEDILMQMMGQPQQQQQLARDNGESENIDQIDQDDNMEDDEDDDDDDNDNDGNEYEIVASNPTTAATVE